MTLTFSPRRARVKNIHIEKLNLKGQSVQTMEWKQTFPANAIICCPSVRSHNSKTTGLNFTNFCAHCVCHGSVLLWWCCDTLCTSGFVDDVMFSYHGANRPETSTTLCIEGVQQLAVLDLQRLVEIIRMWHREGEDLT